MKLTARKCTAIFRNVLENDQQLQEALSVVRMNTPGRLWIIGGYVFRSLAHALYGNAEPAPDVDVIISEGIVKPVTPRGWRVSKNHFGNFKLVKNGGMGIDIVPLSNVHSITRRGLRPSIRNYLTGVPLSVQSVAFDMQSRCIIGVRGIRAIGERLVYVNNLAQAKYNADRRGISITELVRQKADAVGFTPLL